MPRVKAVERSGATPQMPVGQMEVEVRARDMQQIAAISAFEGMRPTPDYEQLRSRYTSGEIGAQEFKRLVLERWKSS